MSGKCILYLSFLWMLCYHSNCCYCVRVGFRRVKNCSSFKRALNSPSISSIQIVGYFECETFTWQEPIVINRPVNITGKVVNGINPTIDWKASRKGIVAGVDSVVWFKNLVFIQQQMGIGGVDLMFFDAEVNTTAHFASIVVGVVSCPQLLSETQVQGLANPSYHQGGQEIKSLNSDTLLIENIVIYWSRTNALWHLYHAIFTCNIYDNDPMLDTYYTMIQDPDEELHHKHHIESNTVASLTTSDNKSEGSSKGMGTSMIIMIGVFSMVALFVILTVAYLGRKKGLAFLNFDDIEMSISKSFEDNNTSKHGPSTVWNLLDSDVSLESPLGHGEFGKVYKASWQGTTVAVKIIQHKENSSKTRDSGMFEAFLAKHISHPNVVQTYQISTKNTFPDSNGNALNENHGPVKINHSSGDSCSSEEMFGCFDDGNRNPCFDPKYETWIVLEYCDGGSLLEAIMNGSFRSPSTDSEQQSPEYKVTNIAKTALEIAGAMNYLHSVRIIHGDLKPGNVLLKKDASDPRGFICKVGDFGLSRFLAENSQIETFTCGTVTHMPPELLNIGQLTSASDVYSFGILLWEIFSGKKPFDGKTTGEIILSVVNKKIRPQLPPNVPEDFSELIESCWHQDYTQRPCFPDIIDRLAKILKNWSRLEKHDSGLRPPPGALDTAGEGDGVVMHSSFFISEDNEKEGEDVVVVEEHTSARRRPTKSSFRLGLKRFNSMKNTRITNTTIAGNTTDNSAVAVAGSSTHGLFMDTNRSLHLSLDGKQVTTNQRSIFMTMHGTTFLKQQQDGEELYKATKELDQKEQLKNEDKSSSLSSPEKIVDQQ